MIEALFVTTATSEPVENVDAWRHTMGPASHVTFDINSVPNDAAILDAAAAVKPAVIFYTGATDGPGLPSDETLRRLRKIAPSVILQGDFGDPPWWPMMKHYREAECFDLMVAMDGVKTCPADLVTLTPFDIDKFPTDPTERPIRCGFAGNLQGRPYWRELVKNGQAVDARSSFIHQFGAHVRVRVRETAGAYADYIAFMRSCKMILNTSVAGSGTAVHVKGRTLEASFSGAAVIDSTESPLREWFPPEMFFGYRTSEDVWPILLHATEKEIAGKAAAMGAYAREHYHPAKIYGQIVERLGL